jgi:endonuclease/exonuclease/phosphatase family metal-dependent hydrolase
MRVASYNIHKAVGLDRRRDPERVLRVLGELRADVAALQEADQRFFGRASVLPREMLADHGWQVAGVNVRPRSLGWHGNAILVREGLDVRHAEPLWLDALEPRGAGLTEIETAGGPVRIVGMHLDLSGLVRVKQLRGLIELLSHRAPMPTVMMGDTNDWNRGRRDAMASLPPHLSQVPCGPSFHTRRPLLKLDRIIVDRSWRVRDCGVHVSALSRRASDHLPIWADLGRS